jgi:hypothetical protein
MLGEAERQLSCRLHESRRHCGRRYANEPHKKTTGRSESDLPAIRAAQLRNSELRGSLHQRVQYGTHSKFAPVPKSGYEQYE